MNNEHNESPIMVGFFNALAIVHGTEYAERARADYLRRQAAKPVVTPYDEWDIDDSDFEPDPYPENDDFRSDADAADDFYNREF